MIFNLLMFANTKCFYRSGWKSTRCKVQFCCLHWL